MPTSPIKMDLLQDILGLGRQAAGLASLVEIDPRLFVMRVVAQLLTLVGIIFIGLIVYGGALWMTSGGAEEQVSKAMKILKRSIIGVVIIMLSYSAVKFVQFSMFKAVTDDYLTQTQSCASGQGQATCCNEWQAFQSKVNNPSTAGGCQGQKGCGDSEYDQWRACVDKATELFKYNP